MSGRSNKKVINWNFRDEWIFLGWFGIFDFLFFWGYLFILIMVRIESFYCRKDKLVEFLWFYGVVVINRRMEEFKMYSWFFL